MNKQHFFQSQRTADEQDLGSHHTRTEFPATNANKTGTDAKPSHDEVAKRAYNIYVKQGCPRGHDLEHWLAAENQMIAA